MQKTIIQLKNVWKTYTMGSSVVNALSDLDLDVQRGEFLAIMGPSGSGKCLDSKTKIAMSDGSLPTIKHIYNKKPNKKILCFDFKKGKIVSSNITKFHKRWDTLLEVTTSSNRTIKTTNDHPFFSISDSGLTEIPAKDTLGKYIAIPQGIPLNLQTGQKLNVLKQLLNEKDIIVADSKKIFQYLTFKKNTRQKICKKHKINVGTYDSWMRNNDIPLYRLNQIIGFLDKSLENFESHIKYLKQSNTKNKIKIPYKTSELLLESYGYIAGDGWLDKAGASISNYDEKLKARIKYTFEQVFGIEFKETIPNRLDFSSTTLRHYFKNIFYFPTQKKSRNIVLPEFIYKCNDREIAHFLRALFDCDGYVDKSKNVITITLASKGLIIGLEHLFSRLGIVTRYSETFKRATNSKMEKRKYYTLSIYGLKNLIKYDKKVGFVSPHKSNRLKAKIKSTKRADTNVNLVPCTKLIRETRRALNISIKRIKKRCGKDFWQLEGTNRNPKIETVELIIEIFKSRLNEVKSLEPSLKLTKDLGFSKREIKTIQGVKQYKESMIKRASTLIKRLEQIYVISKNIFWDRVKSIKKLNGKKDVYDLTVGQNANFIANNIIVHNSTMVNMVGCLDIPTKGDIYLDDQNISHLTESDLAQIRGKKIGFIFQTFNLIPTLTALENVMLPMMFQNISAERRKSKAEYLLGLVKLGDRINHKPNQMSGGQQQRVAIARSLANNPEVLLADEPTGNLDTKTGEIVMDFLDKLHKKDKKTVIMVTHDKDMAKHAERIVHLKDGTIKKIVKRR